jgi:hypothetical protein
LRASDILESVVLDADGQEVGQVHDIRMVREGPIQGVFGPGYRVQGLVVGPAATGVRLGFDRSNMDGPALLKSLFRRIHRHARLVDWSLIETMTEGEIRLRVRRKEILAVPDR